MRKNSEVELLKKISGIRQLQHTAAKAELARTRIALSEKEKALKLRQIEEETAEKHWRDAVSGASLRLETVPIWAASIVRQGVLTRQAVSAVEDATTTRDRSVTALYMAESRSEVATEQARSAYAERQRKLEEDAVHDAADRHLQHGIKP